MTERFARYGVCTLAAVALLLAVMSSPIRPPVSQTPPPPNYLPRCFAILKFGFSGQTALSSRPTREAGEADFVPSDTEDELDADTEDELTVTSPPASVPFGVLLSSCPKPYSEPVSSAVALTARPLRC